MGLPLDAKDLSFLGGAASLLVGALSYWAKTRHEQRRATRTVLYYLLEHHHHVRRAHESVKGLQAKFLIIMRASLKTRGLDLSDQDWGTVQNQVAPLVRAFLSSELQELLGALREPLERALVDLARENPVLAFRIRGRDRIMQLNEKITKLAGPEAAPDEATLGFFEAHVGDVALRELRDCVYATARACDVITLLKVHLAIRRHYRPDPKEDAELQKFVDGMLTTVLQARPAG